MSPHVGAARILLLPEAIARLLPSARFVRFLGAGAVNTLFGYGVFVLASALGADATLALVISTTLGILFNFQTSRRIVFRPREPGLLLRFVCVYLALFVVNDAALLALAPLGLPNWAAQAILILPMALLAFLGQRRFVFATLRERACPPPRSL